MHLQRQIGWSGVHARAWSQAVSTVSKREVDQDEFQEILEEQGRLVRCRQLLSLEPPWLLFLCSEGLADFKEEEPIKPKMVERTDPWRPFICAAKKARLTRLELFLSWSKLRSLNPWLVC